MRVLHVIRSLSSSVTESRMISSTAAHACPPARLPACPLRLTRPSQLHLREDEAEPRPPTRANGTLEPGAGAGRVPAHEKPVADPEGERRGLHVGGIGGRDHFIRADFASIQAKALCVGVCD